MAWQANPLPVAATSTWTLVLALGAPLPIQLPTNSLEFGPTPWAPEPAWKTWKPYYVTSDCFF